MIKFALADGSWAYLEGIVQTGHYGRPYLEIPKDPIAEVMRLAKLYIPANAWPPAPILPIGIDSSVLREQMRRNRPPAIMCIGLFTSTCYNMGLSPRPFGRLWVVWLQEDFLPYFSPENEVAFKSIDWDKFIGGHMQP